MSAALYRNFKKHLLKKEIDLTVDALKAYLVTSAYVFSQAHEFVSDLGANILKSVALASVTVDQPNPGTVDCADFTFTAVTGTFKAIVYARDTGNAATSPLIAFDDTIVGFPDTVNNASVPINVDNGTDRLFTL